MTPDDLHPNDAGHALLANLITHFLKKVQKEDLAEVIDTKRTEVELPKPITANAYQNSVRYQTYNSTPELKGFVADTEEQSHITDIFKRGFVGKKAGNSIRFEIEGTGIAVQYRKSVKHPACVAKVVLDGDEENAMVLDGNFDETWGDCLYITTVAKHIEDKKHSVEITITEGDEAKVPFYLVSVIGSR